MSNEPIQFIFSVAPLQSALKRAHDGGGRLTIDIPQSDMSAINRLMDMAVAQGGIAFAAAVVAVGSTEEPPEDIERVQLSSTNGSSKTHNRTARRPTDVD